MSLSASFFCILLCSLRVLAQWLIEEVVVSAAAWLSGMTFLCVHVLSSVNLERQCVGGGRWKRQCV